MRLKFLSVLAFTLMLSCCRDKNAPKEADTEALGKGSSPVASLDEPVEPTKKVKEQKPFSIVEPAQPLEPVHQTPQTREAARRAAMEKMQMQNPSRLPVK